MSVKLTSWHKACEAIHYIFCQRHRSLPKQAWGILFCHIVVKPCCSSQCNCISGINKYFSRRADNFQVAHIFILQCLLSPSSNQVNHTQKYASVPLYNISMLAACGLTVFQKIISLQSMWSLVHVCYVKFQCSMKIVKITLNKVTEPASFLCITHTHTHTHLTALSGTSRVRFHWSKRQ